MVDTPPSAIPTGDIRLGELLSALSHALDMTEGQPVGHGVRCAWIGLAIGRALHLGPAAIADLHHVLLLKDLGCSSNAARICQLYLTDDRSFKHDYKTIDGSLPQALRFVLSHTGLTTGLAERFRALVHIFRNGGEIARELIETRCQRGAEIARKMRFGEAVAAGIRNLDEHWDGSGKPTGLAGAAIPLASRIALLAQVVDVFHTASGREAALREVRLRAGGWFDPALVAVFEQVARDEGFWATLSGDEIEAPITARVPELDAVALDEDYIDDIAAAFAQVVDTKSPFTRGHSERVTIFTDLIAAELGFSAERRRWLRRAALLHDIGKLGVSNTILDKPGKLDADEWQAVQMHAAHSEAILSRIGAFATLAPIAAAHHERLDGKGYPKGLAGDEITLETRIISTADIFDALTAERPYRAAMPVDRAFAILDDLVGPALDGRCVAALKRALVRIDDRAAA